MTSRDHDFIADRFVNIKDKNAEFGEIPFYERENIFDGTTKTECLICIEAENENHSKYAHSKAHLEAHTKANTIAEDLAIEQDIIVDYMYRYLFFYGKEYKKLYFEFTGGEPFMIQEHFDMLQGLVDRGIAHNVEIHYNTNGTHWP